MNLATTFIPIVSGNIFTEFNRLVNQATSSFNLLVALIAAVAFLVVAITGSWKLKAVIIGAISAGLIYWLGTGGFETIGDLFGDTIG